MNTNTTTLTNLLPEFTFNISGKNVHVSNMTKTQKELVKKICEKHINITKPLFNTQHSSKEWLELLNSISQINNTSTIQLSKIELENVLNDYMAVFYEVFDKNFNAPEEYKAKFDMEFLLASDKFQNQLFINKGLVK